SDKVRPMSKNPLELLTTDPLELSMLTTKAKLMIIATEIIREKGWNQTEASTHLGISQPRVSNLMKSQVHKFSIDGLLEILGKLGYLPDMTFEPDNKLRPIKMELKKAAL
ncbi:helix-turn-helix domain-containing protein, partial [Vibrio parahaemolyticus]